MGRESINASYDAHAIMKGGDHSGRQIHTAKVAD